MALSGQDCSLTDVGATGVQLQVEHRSHSFRFDEVCGRESTQEEIFQRAHPLLSLR